MTNKECPKVVIETSMGPMTAELWPDKAPETVANFLSYVDDGYYDDLIFHRVIENFMIQGGGFAADMTNKETGKPVKNEATCDLRNDHGTLAMARTTEVDSATSQFFVNLADNDFLNHTATTPQGYGYCVFGKLSDGLDVLGEIGTVETCSTGMHENVPSEPIIIKSIKRCDA